MGSGSSSRKKVAEKKSTKDISQDSQADGQEKAEQTTQKNSDEKLDVISNDQEEVNEESQQKDDDNLDLTSRQLLEKMLLENIETYDGNLEVVNENGLQTNTPRVKEDEAPSEQFQPNYANFPSHTTLRQENKNYQDWKKLHPDSSDLHPGYPEPDTTRKSEIFNSEEFSELDLYVLETPSSYLDKSLHELVTYLIRDCNTDIKKTRAIFRWICAQDLNELTGIEGDTTPRQLLMKLKNGENEYDYSSLFQEMCSISGLTCLIIRGTIRAMDNEFGHGINPEEDARSCWNVVRIGDKWRLFDVDMASRTTYIGDHGEWEMIDRNGEGYMDVEEASDYLVYEVNEFYFLTDPEEFIYSHFPDEEGWQLLARPVSRDEFQKMAYLVGSFFTMGMDVRQAKRFVTHSTSGETVLSFGLPPGESRFFGYHLWKSKKDGTLDSNEQDLGRCVFMEQRNTTLTAKVMYPSSGKYMLRLFISKTGKSDEEDSWSSSHLLLCTKESSVRQLLSNDRYIWGPSEHMKQLGMVAENWNGTIETENGEAEVVFSCNQEIEIIVKLTADYKTEDEFAQWILWRMVGGKLIINLRMLEAGQYALMICAKKKGDEGALPHVGTYLVNVYSEVPNRIKFPEVPNQQAGEEPEKAKFQLDPISHNETYFLSSTGQEVITMRHKLGLNFKFKLRHQQEDDLVEELDGYTFHSKATGQVEIHTRFPKAGMYDLTVYAKEGEADEPYGYAFRYIVLVPLQMKDCRPFPKQLRWDAGCSIEGLDDGILEEKSEMKVKATVPNASGVAVIVTNGSYYLEQESGFWVGSVNTGDAGKHILLGAKYGEESEEYEHLTEYEVKSKEELSAKKKEDEKAFLLQEEKIQEFVRKRRKYEVEVEALETELKSAISSEDVTNLVQAVRKVEEMACTNKLNKDYTTARNLIKSLERMNRLNDAIMTMDQGAMAEIRSYNQPPKPVHDVMSSALLLLGNDEEKTKDWSACKSLLNTNTLRKSVHQFNPKSTNPEIASRCLSLVQPYRMEEVAEISTAAACFYAWTVGMCEEVNVLTNGQVQRSIPAKVRRQKEIFQERH